MKEIRISDHAQQKIKILANHEINLNIDFILETIRSPDLIEIGENDKKIAQKRLNEKLLVSLFIRASDLGFLKPLYSKAPFFIFDPARKIRDTNEKLILKVVSREFAAFILIITLYPGRRSRYEKN